MDQEPEIIGAKVIDTKGASEFQKALVAFLMFVSPLYTTSPMVSSNSVLVYAPSVNGI